MKPTRKKSLIFISACVLFLARVGGGARPSEGGARLAGGMKGKPQSGWKVVKKSSRANEPIKIIKVKSKAGDIEPGKQFKGDAAEWLRDFTITVENTSGKTITYLGFALFFPVTGNHSTGELPYTFDLMFGVSPSSEHYSESRRRRPYRIIRQKERFDLALSDEQYNHIRKALTALGYPPDIREMEIWLDEVGFDDGTSWPGGQTSQPDGASKQIKKPTGESRNKGPALVKASFATAAPAPVQSRWRRG